MKKTELERTVSILSGKVVLLFIVAILAFITIFAMATNYVLGLACSVILIIALRVLISAPQIEEFLKNIFNDDDGILK